MYSPVSKYSPEARKRSPYRSKGKSCGYYMRIVFFFSSLIQSLIIVSLVLFLVYGKQQDSASVERVQDLEMRFSRLSIENVDLTHQRQNLTKLLNITMREKARNDWDLANLMSKTNVSFHFLGDLNRKLEQCILEKKMLTLQGGNRNCPPEARAFGTPCNCGHEMELLKARMEYIKSNFTQTAMKMQIEMDQISKERDNLNLEAIRLRRDKSMHEKEIHFYKIKCKDDFVQSLSGVSNVSKAFLHKIDSLFSSHHAFQISCPKQKEYLEQIRTNCTNLSWEVEDRFQRYLNKVGEQVSTIQGENSRLTAENWRMSEDYRWCSQNRTGLIREHRQNIDRVQLKHDEEKEKLLKEKMKLNGNIELMESSVRLKNTEIQHLKEQLKQLNMSCLPRTGFGGLLPGGSSRTSGTQTGSSWGVNTGSSSTGSSGSTGGLGQAARNPFGGSSSSSSSSFGSSFGSTGSNTGLGSNLGSTNTGFNKQPSTGLGSSNLGFGSSASNSGLGTSGLNKPASSNPGASSFGSSFGSNPSSSGTGLNKQPGSTGLGSSPFGSSLGSSSSSSSNSPSSSGSSSDRFGSSSNRFGASGATGASSSGLGSNFGSSSSSLGSSLGSGSSSSSRTTQNARGSSSNSFFGSSSSSSSQSLDSSLNKPSTSGKSSVGSSLGSSSSSSGSSSSTPSKSSFGSWWGLGGGTSTDQSKSGSGTQGRGASSSGGTFGSFGRNSAFTAPVSVNEHLRDLQRIINPPGPEEKQELSRMLG